MSAVTVRGVPEVRAMLAKVGPEEMKRRTKLGLREAGKVAKSAMVSEAPAGYERMRRKGSIQVRATRRGKPGIWVKYNNKKVYFKHMVMGGTKPHGPRGRSKTLGFVPNWNPYMSSAPPAGARWVSAGFVRGVRPNPIVDRAFAKAERPMTTAMMDKLTEGL